MDSELPEHHVTVANKHELAEKTEAEDHVEGSRRCSRAMARAWQSAQLSIALWSLDIQ